MLWTLLFSVAATAFTAWVLVKAARRTDAPWWKIWLLGRGMYPTGDELRAGQWSKSRHDREGDHD